MELNQHEPEHCPETPNLQTTAHPIPGPGRAETPAEVAFADVAHNQQHLEPDKEEAEQDEDADDAAPQKDEDGQEGAESKPPASETLSIHVHRSFSSGRTVIAVLSGTTDPYYHQEQHLDSLADSLALLPAIYGQATDQWTDAPRYPSHEPPAKESTISRSRFVPPLVNSAAAAQPSLTTQQAALF